MSPLSVDRAPARDRNSYLAMIPQLEQEGFLRIPVNRALRQTTDRAFALADAFFARPAAEKHPYAHPEWVEGYREQGPEYSQVPERPDLMESFSAWNRNRSRPELAAWETRCPLYGTLREASTLLAEVVRDLFAAMRDYYKPDAPELPFYNGTYVQLNHYEPARHRRDLLTDPHEDGHLITLAGANAPGLEIKVNGAFVPANLSRDEMLLMPGSLLTLMTGGRVRPGYHQVRNSRRTDPRSSLLYFVNPEIDRPLAPWIENESNHGIDIIARANAAPQQFGLSTLQDGQTGHAQTRTFDLDLKLQ
jgi:isopenicillin N synthase-like dioxygenase